MLFFIQTTYFTPINLKQYGFKEIDETHFKFTKGEVQSSETKCDIPELMLPNEIIMTRTQSDLNEEEFPEIEKNDNYDFCPTYRYGTKWQSDDDQVVINNIDCFGNLAGKSSVTFTTEPNSVYYIAFFEVNSKAYLVRWENDSLSDFSEQEFRKATEEWQCEYFENYFTAQVIRSNYYEVGHTISFTLVEIP